MKVDLHLLDSIRTATGKPFTVGLTEELLASFLEREDLATAIRDAVARFESLSADEKSLLQQPEELCLRTLQQGFLNFYPAAAVSPYIPLAGKGPWIVSAYGAVIYDTGGYGMLGHGHNPDCTFPALSSPFVMANIMTSSLEQRRFDICIRKEIGHTRKDGCPFEKFICMNSGSEAMSVATRISDLYAAKMTEAGARAAGRTVKILALKGAFHGRTGRPARASNSSLKVYRQLASFKNYTGTLIVEPNDTDNLERVFREAEARNEFIEFMVLEPVMGEGNPGLAITPEFYARARELTRLHGSLLLVDSIQAGLRTQGVLSIVDYPGFQELDAPDMESYSKALNAGQFPVSVLAVSRQISNIYKPGIYGNTMTANPRALALTEAVLNQVTDALRTNIRDRGREFVERLEALQKEHPGKILSVQGTGLLVSCELGEGLLALGAGSVEEEMRRAGVNVIHGGVNSLRFTPGFSITSEEIDLIIKVLKLQL